MLYTGELASIGEFVCPPGDPAWDDVNVIGDEIHFVYPRTHVLIEQLGHQAVLATRNHVIVYEAGQRYRRSLTSPAGDRCFFLAVARGREEEIIAEVGGSLPAPSVPLPAVPYLLAHSLFAGLQRAEQPDGLVLEEALATLILSSVRAARPAQRSVRRSHARTLALVEATKALLAETYTRRATLADVATPLHVSPWHLARVFRKETGFTIHAYRAQLRLRAALELLDDGLELTAIALTVGFSSHSHLTTAFSRAFGRPPSLLRRAELSTILKAIPRPAS